MRHPYKDQALEKRIRALWLLCRDNPKRLKHYKRALKLYALKRELNKDNYIFKGDN